MVKKSSTQQNGLIDWLKESFSDLTECEELNLEAAYHLGDKKVCIHSENYPIQLNIGRDRQALHIYPEWPIDQSKNDSKSENYLIFEPRSYYKGKFGFIRIKLGEKLILGKGKAEQRDLLNISQNIPERHLSIVNDGGNLLFKNFDREHGTCVSPLLTETRRNRIRNWRLAKLKRLRSIVGGPIELKSPDDALSLIRRVNKLMGSESYRAKDGNGQPGGVIELPSGVTPFLVGDLHTKVDNLLVVMNQSCFLKALRKGTAALIIIGDAVHCEDHGRLEEMESSMLMMDLIFRLKLNFPKQVFYLRGNHDSFSAEIGKRGVPQGLLWKKALVKTRGKAYREEMTRFYDQLPYIAYSEKFIACHAGPPTSSTSRKQLINVRDYPKLMYELTNNRLRNPSKPTGYFKREVKKLRKYLDLNSDTPVIVGHTPLSCDDTLWVRPREIDNHYVIYGGYDKWVGVMTQAGDRIYPFRYPVEQLLPLINAIED